MNYWELYKLYGNIDFRWAHFNKFPYEYPFKTLNDTQLTGFIAGKKSLHLIGDNITVYGAPVKYNVDPTLEFDGLSLVHKDYVDSLAGGPPGSFILLGDTPASYSGEAGNILAVNVGETALEFISPPSGVTNLTYFGKVDSGDILSDTGTDATIPAASTTLAGLLTAADKLKLDGVESGAAADQNASEVPVTASPANYTASTADVEAHLAGIDVALGSIGGGVTDHGALTGLSDDDHTQYHNDTRGDARYYTQSLLDAGQLDSRYYTETEVDTLLSGKADDPHTHVLADITDVTALASEVNLLDLSGLTAGWVLAATTSSTAAWGQLNTSDLNNDEAWIDSAGAPVQSVFSRTGDVVAAASDYDADQVDYDNTTSGLSSTNVQSALDEIEGRVDTLEGSAFPETFSVVKTTNQSLTGSFADVTTWDTAHKTTASVSFNTTTGIVTFNADGTYMIVADFSFIPPAAVAVTASIKMQEDTGSGYTDVSGTRRRESMGDTTISTGTSMGSVTISYIKTWDNGDTIKFQTQFDTGAAGPAIDEATLNIVKIG